MTAQQYRLPEGGLINRSKALTFRFDGRQYSAFEGDTLASALLANGVKLVGRSFKFHRPRGVVAAGSEEPNALVTIGEGKDARTNIRATEVQLFDGLVASPINCWPSLRFDFGAVNNLMARFIPAGFYYKTFMWPSWRWFEWPIRNAAGLGVLSQAPDMDIYDQSYAHCDVLVVGAGPSGLAAALAAAEQGARVILCDRDRDVGGRLLWTEGEIDGQTFKDWRVWVENLLSKRQDVTILKRTVALGYFDHNNICLLECSNDGEAALRHRLWMVRARQTILATGAIERPLIFPGNDRPGVMLADSALQYLKRYAVNLGNRIFVLTNNDSAYQVASQFARNGSAVLIGDLRSTVSKTLVAKSKLAGVSVLTGVSVNATLGARAVNTVQLCHSDGTLGAYPCDLLLMSGGFGAATQLLSQSGGRLRFDDERQSFVPAGSVQNEVSAGGARGTFFLPEALKEGHTAGKDAALRCGASGKLSAIPVTHGNPESMVGHQISAGSQFASRKNSFVDFQNDVTLEDFDIATRENLTSIEHLKRYTTLGMGPDQGKLSATNAAMILADILDTKAAEIGTPKSRFPEVSAPIGALAGLATANLFRPQRLLPLHSWHQTHHAVFEEYGEWLRPAWYKRSGTAQSDAEVAEIHSVRNAVGLFDASPLGKIAVAGPDAGRFLDQVYANTMSSLQVGRCRYGMMLDERGVVIDDGIATRVDEEEFLLSTTSAGCERIVSWLEEWHQCEWPELNVLITPLTTAFAVIAIAGPRARSLLQRLAPEADLHDANFPHMTTKLLKVSGIPIRANRVSFTGELSYELSCDASQISTLWSHAISAGAEWDVRTVGINAWNLLRMEKGYVHIGVDTDGSTLATDLGWHRILKREGDFIGKRSLQLVAREQPHRLEFVGVEPADPKLVLPVGSHIRSHGEVSREFQPYSGYVTSSGYSGATGRSIALGMFLSGRSRISQPIQISVNGQWLEGRIVEPGWYDREGKRQHE